MITIDANGARLSLAIFTKAYKEARKLAPARFLTLRMHPSTFDALVAECADVAEVVQIGDTPGPLGRKVTRVACVPAPTGVGDGVAIKKDDKADATKLEYLIHGIPELTVINLGV